VPAEAYLPDDRTPADSTPVSKGVATPPIWQAGQDVIIPPTVNDSDAKAKFGSFDGVFRLRRLTKAPD